MNFEALSRAYTWPLESAVLRAEPGDFRVEEALGFAPDGAGEHLWVQLEKTSLTTPQAADQLARLLSASPRQVSWSGMKDRNAVTTQWFSVHLPGPAADDLQALRGASGDSLRLLQAARHSRKLRPGTHQSNHFEIRLRHCTGVEDRLVERLQQVAVQGVPNYFGPQRFGNDQSNLQGGKRGRRARAMHLSAVRALLFNAVLDARLQQQNWCHVLPGDALQFTDGGSFFRVGEGVSADQVRVDAGELHVTGPLYAGDEAGGVTPADRLEYTVLQQFPQEQETLMKAGMKPARRALRMVPLDLRWSFGPAREVLLRFSLRSGCYATSLLRELFVLEDARGRLAA